MLCLTIVREDRSRKKPSKKDKSEQEKKDKKEEGGNQIGKSKDKIRKLRKTAQEVFKGISR